MTTTPVSATPASTQADNNRDLQDPTASLADRNMFLQLLVAQLKHQNPLNPADGLQFVTQLAQFTALEQSTQMREDLSAIRELLANVPEALQILTEGAAGTAAAGSSGSSETEPATASTGS